MLKVMSMNAAKLSEVGIRSIKEVDDDGSADVNRFVVMGVIGGMGVLLLAILVYRGFRAVPQQTKGKDAEEPLLNINSIREREEQQRRYNDL